MKLICTLIIFFVFLVNNHLVAQEKDTAFYINTAFKSEEKLIYKVRYGLIKGGEASMTINTVPSGDTYLFHIKAMAETTGIVGAMVTIKDIYESFVNIATGYPLKSVRNIRESSYTSYNEVLFFREQGFLRSLKSGDKEAPENVLDILSAFYYARRYLFSNKLSKNEIINLTTFFDDEFFPIEVRFKRIETVKTKFGKIQCLLFSPVLGAKSPFKNEDQFQVWVTADENYIPVKIRVKLPIGSLKCDILDFEGIKNEYGQLQK